MGRFEAFVGVNFWTALFVLLNTLTIYFVAKKFLFGPVMKIIHDRQQEIDDMYAQAQSAQDSAKALESEYQTKLETAQETSDRLVKEAVARGKSREEEIIRQANREADAIREKASADIAREKKQAVSEAKNEISSLAMEIAGKVVGQSLDAARQEQLVDSFLEELGEQP
ncbi:MAG: F0F1 ATP synthase subunit B [Oscillospiraceae bacterium]|nr:F0F1 ATP synthase subunit B [Oscillospiraceae bacterium]MBQ7330161.1 F0F1 ATP synthase subunit B [Oscillospiraceae bacterium]MBQ7767870.1 F0F1 ATP synthase subunit B [Oscillospiraceae bacterium]